MCGYVARMKFIQNCSRKPEGKRLPGRQG